MSISSMLQYEHLVAGLSGGFISTLVVHPLDLLKIRFAVNEGNSAVRPQHRSYWGLTQDILRSRGLGGLYQGVVPNLIGATAAWGLYFQFYNILKSWMRRTENEDLSPYHHLSAGVLAGTATLALTNPIWVVKTRLCLQYEQQEMLYKGFLDALVKIYRKEGIRGWYKKNEHKYMQLYQLFLLLEEKFKEGAVEVLREAFRAMDYGFLATEIIPRKPSFQYPQTLYRLRSTNSWDPDKRYVGSALIICNTNFVPRRNRIKKITSSTQSLPYLREDSDRLKSCFQGMRYYVRVLYNRKSFQMESDIWSFVTHGQHSDADSCIGIILCSFDAEDCPGLVGKPKIFLSSACRSPKVRPIGKLYPPMEKHPSQADTFVAYSTTWGNRSWGCRKHGSLFLNTVCNVLDEKALIYDIHDIFSEVNRRMTEIQTGSLSGWRRKPIQLTETVSKLRKGFYFRSFTSRRKSVDY